MDPRPALVLNAGSSSVKAAVLAADGSPLWRGQHSWCPDSAEALLESWLPDALAPWLTRADGLAFAGHRLVHGGERFAAPTRLTAEVITALKELTALAPLHNAPALKLIRTVARWLPDLPQWACFDTAFHATLPPEARTYAIPEPWRQAGLRRFGFHGLNHQHVAETVARSDPQARRLISCHLGGGCSLCAIGNGRSLATTMGFSPLEGLVMATRSGSLDPGVILHQLRRGMELEELDHSLHHASGLLGLSSLSGDMATLRRAQAEGHAGAALAIAVFRHRLLQEIGAMAATLGGVDVIALSGGIGEHDTALQAELKPALAWLAPFTLRVIGADEEGLIARSCRAAAL
ncbi:MAG: acetate kinase [Synechococcaceae cyanobacterium]|nr:acetate kinase [Synechococcaceae cyanobacterium]